ncbi:MAG: hypothetical protein P8Y95_06990 [Gammaproteobacteria bacterium]
MSTSIASDAAPAARSLQWLANPWRALLAVIMSQGLLGSLLLLGYLYRLMQRQALKYWWRTAGSPGGSFSEFAAAEPATREHATLPNWFIAQDRRRDMGERSSLRAWARAMTASLLKNLRRGVTAALTLWSITLPGCVLMLFAWYDGWNNSFIKGYENAPVGPLTGILGLVLFAVAASYVPMAQARHAASDQWRAFFEVRTNLILIRTRAFAAAGLAAGYLAASVPVTLIFTLPGFLPQMGFMSERYATMSDAEVLSYLEGWYFWGGLVFVSLLVLLKRAGAHLYAGALVRGIERGFVRLESLSEFERSQLVRLGVGNAAASTPGRRRRGILVLILLTVPWILLTVEIFVAQFFTYQASHGWLNQPLLQLPWMNYVPNELRVLAAGS